MQDFFFGRNFDGNGVERLRMLTKKRKTMRYMADSVDEFLVQGVAFVSFCVLNCSWLGDNIKNCRLQSSHNVTIRQACALAAQTVRKRSESRHLSHRTVIFVDGCGYSSDLPEL